MANASDPSKPAAGAQARPPVRRAPALSRQQFLKALPLHLLLAALSGAVTAVLLSLLTDIQLSGYWRYILILPIGAVYVNGAIMPLVVPGRHFSFGFLCAMMLIMICLAGGVLSTWLRLPHSFVDDAYLSKINTVSFIALVTGLSLGLFYGILVGTRHSLTFGAILGTAGGYLVGLGTAALVSHESGTRNQFVYGSLLDFAWQGAAAMLALHLFGAIGALMGAQSTVAPSK
ncbi:MAG TPA: hypothetical protein VEJ63_05975 [Planctomycetota bacterium]|nr:hypothetical protein [Planctomycetota bacterium]